MTRDRDGACRTAFGHPWPSVQSSSVSVHVRAGRAMAVALTAHAYADAAPAGGVAVTHERVTVPADAATVEDVDESNVSAASYQAIRAMAPAPSRYAEAVTFCPGRTGTFSVPKKTVPAPLFE